MYIRRSYNTPLGKAQPHSLTLCVFLDSRAFIASSFTIRDVQRATRLPICQLAGQVNLFITLAGTFSGQRMSNVFIMYPLSLNYNKFFDWANTDLYN